VSLAAWDRSHAAFYDAFTAAAPGGRVAEVAPGVRCAVTPTAPERSIPNAVLCADADALRDALPAVRALYADAGVRAWTVWVGPGRDALEAVCREAGLAHDGSPPLMHAPLADVDLSAPPVPDVVDDGPAGEVWAVNSRAFGMPPGDDFVSAFPGEPDPALRRSVAHGEDGAPLGAVCWVRSGEDAYVCLVGVLPEARGRGLCTGLMAHALRRAREEGAVTTTLEASPMGRPVYARMGYREIGPCGLWESRVPAA
jgi:GNAT superfamily N-acetyltransferase